MTGREPAGPLDRDVTDTLDLIADEIGGAAERAAYLDAGHVPPRRVLHDLIAEALRIAAAARGQVA